MEQRQNLSSHNPLNRSFTLASLLRFAAPAIGMMLTLSLYSIIDGIFIGRFVGDTALAASNIVYPAFNLVLGIAIMLASGGSALVAKTLGEQLPDKASQYFTQLLLAAFCIGIFLEIFIFGFSTPLLQLLGAKGAMLAPAQDYLKSMMLFTPFFIVKAIFDNFFIADGRPLFGFLVSGQRPRQYAAGCAFHLCLRLGHLRSRAGNWSGKRTGQPGRSDLLQVFQPGPAFLPLPFPLHGTAASFQ